MRRCWVFAFVAGCAIPMAEGPDAEEPAVDQPELVETGRFQRCVDHPFTLAADEGWRHTSSKVIALGDAGHSAADVIAHPGTTPYVGAKFAYGAISKDLEDEDVLAFIDTCNGWRLIGRGPTDSDGRVKVKLPALPTGMYEVRFQVAGDQSTTSAFAYALPAGTHLVLSDVDGTLTQSDRELFKQILDGSHVPVAYPAAADLISAHTELGQVPLYLTGRPYVLAQSTRGWLAGGGFPRSALRVTDSLSDSVPSSGSVGAFKRARIAELVAAGYVIDAAYGNATTDISAYLGAGIPADRVWIIGANAGEQGTHAVSASWAARAAEVGALPRVDQPFLW